MYLTFVIDKQLKKKEIHYTAKSNEYAINNNKNVFQTTLSSRIIGPPRLFIF